MKSPVTSTRWTSDSSPRPTKNVDRFIVHHAYALTIQAILNLFAPGGRVVSANFAIGQGHVVATVPTNRRAWTSGSEHWDGRAWTVEVANASLVKPWPIRAVDFHNLARLIAYWSIVTNTPINDTTVITHQELYLRYGASYATACPGDLQTRKGELLALARQYAAGKTFAGEPTLAVGSADLGYGLTKRAQEDVQQRLKDDGLYTGPVDGVFGEKSVMAFQQKLKDLGYLSASYVVDGVPGPLYGGAIQDLAAKHGYTGPRDKVPGKNTSAAISVWAKNLLVKVQPTKFVRSSWLAGAPYWPEGPLMVRIQKALKKRGRYNGATDGIGGPNTAIGIQRTLNYSALNGVKPYVRTAEDGKLGVNNAWGVQHYGKKYGDYTGAMDGDPRENSWAAFVLGLELP